MTRYLLDTNVLSALVRTSTNPITHRIKIVGESSIYTSVIAAGELRCGAVKKGSARLAGEVEAVLSRINVAFLQPGVSATYAALRHALEATGTPIGANDLWIAAQAAHDESVVVTDNTREFSRVPNLRVENWLRDEPGR